MLLYFICIILIGTTFLHGPVFFRSISVDSAILDGTSFDIAGSGDNSTVDGGFTSQPIFEICLVAFLDCACMDSVFRDGASINTVFLEDSFLGRISISSFLGSFFR